MKAEKVICIKNSSNTRIDDYLKIGRIYECSVSTSKFGGGISSDDYVLICNDIGPKESWTIDWYPADWFVSVVDWRNSQIDKVIEI